MAGCLAGGFAKGFGYLDDGLLAGLVHDLGKYSDAFQRRIRNPDHCGPVDHSTAGALLLMRHACPLAAMAVAGHHAGLPDLGSYGELEGPTFMSRMNRARRAGDCNPLALAQAGEAQLDIPQSAFLHGTRSAKPMTSSKRSERWSLYTDMMLTRMLFSALVDADRLDAEFFTSNRIDRAEHHILESLKKHLGPQNLTSGRVPAFDALREASLTVSVERDAEDRSRIDRLAAIMEEAADGYLAAPDKRPIDIRRCELLERCLACGKDPSYGTGLYTLTAPTGSGKTISSIAFALEHARTNNLRRVIYVIPYTSIIDQTVGQFEAIFGTDAVLPHYSEAPYQLKNESDMDETDLRRALAAENWNAPIVVTTAVQFFESLYSNATSRCRKLHNIADSVIVFDEAQTLPVPYLRPCVRAIAELVERYGSTAVLCTATQPELQPLFDESFDGDHVRVPEISPFTRDDRDSFRRVTIKRLGDIALDALAERLGHHKQVLCVVNTRSKAQCLHDRLAEDDAEGSFCLTTLQCAADRQRLFAEIRDRLDAGASCRVVSTSLIEAGVDVDFPVAYREEAGLDSVIQTAGRCNREGRRPVSESVVHVFSTEGGCAPFLRQNIAAFRAVADRHADLNTDEAVRAYFAEVLCLRNGGAARATVGNDALDRKRILPLHGRDANWPFADIAKRFRLIDTPTIPVYIPLPGEGSLLCERLERGDMDRTLFISKIRNDSTKPTRTTTNRERTMTDRKPIENRYDFTILFEVKDGNPNGDPDSGNMPRVDIETGNGLTTDVCVKRKIRDYVQTVMGEQAPWRIYIQNRQTLNRLDSEALKAEHIDTSLESKDFAKEIKALKKTDPELDQRLRDYMCDQFFDIRTFGAVMTTFVKGSLSCGQVRGPVQLGFARSIDPISVQEISITRIAVTTEADAAEKNNTMGNKFIIPYGLYRMNGYISAKLAQNVTGFCDEDLDVLWQAILNMFEFDRSAARGNMAVRKLYVFKHSSALGDAPSWKLFDSINVHKRAEVDAPRDFADYEVRVNREAIPESVSLTEMVDHAL